MFSLEVKKEIADKIQQILQGVNDDELPKGEITFILHVDGAEEWSWANICNDKTNFVPYAFIKNLSIED